MLRGIFKFSIISILATSISFAEGGFKDYLQGESFECEDRRCFVRDNDKDVTYFINNDSVNIKSVGSIDLIADSCDIAFSYFLDEKEFISAKEMLNARIASHNEYFNSEMIFFSKTIYPFFISIGFFDLEQKNAISCYISKQ